MTSIKNALAKKKAGNRFTEAGNCATDKIIDFLDSYKGEVNTILIADKLDLDRNRVASFLKQLYGYGFIEKTGEVGPYGAINYKVYIKNRTDKARDWLNNEKNDFTSLEMSERSGIHRKICTSVIAEYKNSGLLFLSGNTTEKMKGKKRSYYYTKIKPKMDKYKVSLSPMDIFNSRPAPC